MQKKTGAMIAECRSELKLTQTELAQLLGVTNKAISRWETGRGYPDIEILPKLAKTLGISVQELLDGERMAPEQEDQSLQSICNYAADQRRKLNVGKILLIAFILLCLFVRAFPLFVELYYSIVGSPDCVIAADYESLTLWGEEYVPLPLNGYECVMGHVVVDEAQVEDAGFLGKLFFGESVYTVMNAPDYELIFLSTEYDFLGSNVFVLKTKYNEYVRYLEECRFDRYYFSCGDSNWYWKEHEMNREIYDVLVSAENQVSQKVYQQGRCISGSAYVYDENRLFRQLLGEVELIDDRCYWRPSEYRTDYGGFPQYVVDYGRELFYPIPEEYAAYFVEFLREVPV